MFGLTTDQLAVASLPLGFTVAAAIGAISVSGTRARVLWAMFALFGTITLIYWVWHSEISESQFWRFATAAIVPVVVLLVVLTREPVPLVQEPPPPPLTLMGERPYYTLQATLGVILTSQWSIQHDADPDACAQELRDKLAQHRLTAFGRRTPDGVLDPIPYAEWRKMRADAATGNAVAISSGEVVYTDLRFDRDYVDGGWPAAEARI